MKNPSEMTYQELKEKIFRFRNNEDEESITRVRELY